MARWKPHSSPSRSFPFWDPAIPSKLTHKPQQMEVDLSGMQPESITTAIQTPHSTSVLPPSRHCWAFWQYHCSNQPVAHGCPGSDCSRLPPSPQSTSMALQGNSHHLQLSGALLAVGESEDPLRPEGMDCGTPVPMATLMQMSLQAATPADTLSFAYITP